MRGEAIEKSNCSLAILMFLCTISLIMFACRLFPDNSGFPNPTPLSPETVLPGALNTPLLITAFPTATATAIATPTRLLATPTPTVTIPPIPTPTPIPLNSADWSYTELMRLEVEISDLSISSTGMYLALSSDRDGVYVYDRESLGLVWHFLAGEDVNCIAISSDEKILASGGEKLILWDLANGAKIREIDNRARSYHSVVFSHDDRLLASGGWGDTVVTDLQTGKQTILIEDRNSESALAFSPIDPVLATSGFVEMWDAVTGQKLALLYANTDLGPAIGLEFFPDGRRVAALYGEGTIIILDFFSGEKIREVKTTGYYIGGMNLSSDGKLLAVGYSNRDATAGVIILWDMETYSQITTLTGDPEWGAPGHREFSPDGQWLYSAYYNNILSVWNMGSY